MNLSPGRTTSAPRAAAAALAAFALALLALPWLAPRPALAQVACRSAYIQSPADGQVISGTVAIFGGARIESFGFYKLEWATEARPADWSAVSDTIAQPVMGGVLDRWDTTRHPDGLYRLKLTVVDQEGQELCRLTQSGLRLANRGTPEPEGSASPEASASASPEGSQDASPTPEPEAIGAPAGEGSTDATAGPSGERTEAPDGEGDDDAEAAPAQGADGEGPVAAAARSLLPSFGEMLRSFMGAFLITVLIAGLLYRRGRRAPWTG